ncbi:hypothetical protein ESCO_001678 [Escovopsis weberi]|uniref:Uncharacterized protein n=1 Tax=Escovopsis weberi TaxID=150374 RepID=A0A0M9VWF3_ESCWE|nr:hypothetical protein ESCO_001678 [Escovopsis weberi]
MNLPRRASSSALHLLLATLLLSSALLLCPVQANTEKIIFTAPAADTDLDTGLDLDLALTTLTTLADNHAAAAAAAALRTRTNLSRVFHPADGHPAWFLLGDLTRGRRYELRICWSALQPSSFDLDVYSTAAVSASPSLLQSLSEYIDASTPSPPSNTHDTDDDDEEDQTPGKGKDGAAATSAMLLRVRARADYVSHHRSLMQSPPPPVLVDLILDPYVYNLAPRSLLPTAAYLAGAALVAWFLAQWIARSLISIAGSGGRQEKKKQS